MSDSESFTGRTRARKTRRGVKVADVFSRLLITGGGIGTIVAVIGVALFLVWVVVPLFLPARLEREGTLERSVARAPLHLGLDEFRVMGWKLAEDGELQVFRLDDGSLVHTVRPFGDEAPLCASVVSNSDLAAFGFADGTVRLSYLGFQTRFLVPSEVPPGIFERLRREPPGTPIDWEGGLLQLTPRDQLRLQTFVVAPLASERVAEQPIRRVDHVVRPRGPLVVALAGDGDATRLLALEGEEKEDFLTGGKTFALGSARELPLRGSASGAPMHLALDGSGGNVFLAWENGRLERVHCTDLDAAFVAESGRLTEPGARLTALELVLGEETLVWGDDRGNVRAGFLVRISDVDPALAGSSSLANVQRYDGATTGFLITKRLGAESAAVTGLAASSRNRIVVAAHAGGAIRIHNVTNQARIGGLDLPDGESALALAVAPKEDGLLVVGREHTHDVALDLRHPEASLGALFLPVWYEGYPALEHTWQSSSGHTGFEPKFGLYPLIVGTIKATFYSMLFGAPLALLAAIYSSEFLNKRAKAVIKPTVELMASLPSVVLGFLAALVFAPRVEHFVPTAMSAFVCLPLAFVLAAYVWQLLPNTTTLRLQRLRLALLVPPLFVGAALAWWLGPLAERWLFAGDIKAWLSFTVGDAEDAASPLASPFGGWFVLALPVCGVLAALILARTVSRPLRTLAATRERWEMAVLDLLRFVAGCGLTIGLSAVLALLLGGMGFDPRGSLEVAHVDISPLGTYVQRNSLIVGFVMGFAIIPIIYTIADDALSAVPGHLRSASLGAGATPWQTAVRIVVPTAMSGMFSALMIGLGRAVGETMIVLMATGNTPILNFNLFNGFRTLSANIAVELPEAVKDSTHYRTLFLAALTLFLMTFAVNTVAEIVRLRFRKRAYQL